jgi:hypothetical protein
VIYNITETIELGGDGGDKEGYLSESESVLEPARGVELQKQYFDSVRKSSEIRY